MRTPLKIKCASAPYTALQSTMSLLACTLYQMLYKLKYLRTLGGVGLIRDMWPAEIPRLETGRHSLNELRADELVPSTFEDIDQWAYLRQCDTVIDKSR